ncbi:MAG TPA: hypothetical protein VFL90_11330 [Methylomirabilota bacterium]|nr:hypothetical protein [Methylomirabilota bacterium]
MLKIIRHVPIAALLFLAACGAAPIASVAPVSTLDIALEVPPAHRPAVEEILGIMRGQLGLPLPAQVSVYVYDSRSAFRAGLMDEGYVAPDRVNEIASFAAGLARPGRVLLHSRATRGQTEWRRLIAHEMTHVVEFGLAGGDGRADQWLAEGLAERVAFDVLERLGDGSLADRRARALAGARRHPGYVSGHLDLAALGSPREFTLRHQRDGSLETYQLSFLMADYLVQRHGLTTVLDYFRNCREMDRDRAFLRTFGQPIQQFETEVLGYLHGLAAAN